MSEPIVINPVIAREHGINVERLVAFHARWGFTVTTSDKVGRTQTAKTCSCCGKNRPLEDFPQVMREDGQEGRRLRNCQDCIDILPTSAERTKIARRRWKEDKQEAERQGISVDRLRERKNRGNYKKVDDTPSADTRPPRTCRECHQDKPLDDFKPERKGQFHADCVSCRTSPVRECQSCFEVKPLEEFTYNKTGKTVATRRSSGVLSDNCLPCRKASPQGRGYAARVAREAAERTNQ